MAYNPSIIREVLRVRSLSDAQLSERLGIEPDELERELKRKPEPSQSILNKIAKELALPSFVFFMKRAPALNDVIPDFRRQNPSPTAKGRDTVKSIQFAKGIQDTLVRLGAAGVDKLPKFIATTNEDVDAFAREARSFFNITLEDQKNAKDARAFYVLCRQRIEERGIFILQDSFPVEDGSGFCLAHPRYPVIVVNTKQQTRGRRLFTLIHELAHVLMDKTGLSDPFVGKNAIERLCNRFAGSFLVPDTFVRPLLGNIAPGQDPDLDDVRWAARRLKISQEATALRLEQLRLYSAGSYAKWKRMIHNLGNPDFSEKSGGGTEPPPQEKVKLAKYGFRFAKAFDALLRSGLITEINLYRSTGLKPKYARAYFDYARSITPTELQALELDDE